MDKITTMRKQFNWRALLIRFLVNAATLYLIVIVTPRVSFADQSLFNVLLLAVVLGILNSIIKPVIHFFTLPLIFASYGLIVVLVNTVILWLLSWLFPDRLVVDSIFWALVAGALYGIVSAFLESLFGLNTPIVSDESEEAEARERVETQASSVVRTLIEGTEEAQVQLADISTTTLQGDAAVEIANAEVNGEDISTAAITTGEDEE